MAMMAKMRSLAPAFILTVGGLFVLFMVISDSNVLEAIGGSTNNIGVVNGVEISYQEFQQNLEQQREMMRQQSGEDLTEEQSEQLRDQVWDSMVSNILFQQLIDEYGLTVSDDEVRDIILGENPPEFLRQSFIDSLGNFNRQLYEQAIFDPQNREILVQVEESVKQNRLREKLVSLIGASITVGEDEVKRRYIDQNINLNVEYALFEISAVSDDQITVTDDDLMKYYEGNKHQYKMGAQRKLRYVLFPNSPSAEDSNMIRKNLENIVNRIETDTMDFRELINIYSEQPYSRDTLSAAYLSSEIITVLNTASPGDVVGPFLTQQGYALYKYFGTVQSNEPLVNASHILINQYENDQENLKAAEQLYQELKDGADFSKAAVEYSKDPGSAAKGGELGYFGKGMMVPEFENAAFSGKVGEIVPPVKTAYGYHILKINDRISKNYIVERIINEVKQSASTRDMMYTSALDFAYLADKNDFVKEAELLGYDIQETPMFIKTTTIPGLGANKRLIDFSFDNNVGKVSEPHKTFNGFIVAQIADAKAEHFKPFDEVKEQIRPLVIREKKYEVSKSMAQDVYGKINNDLSKVTDIAENAKLGETGNFLPQANIPGIGRDNALVAKALNTELNTLTEPFKGARGYYIIKVINRTEFNENEYSNQSANIRSTIFQEKRTRYLNQWVEKLKENANIEDNRHLFYRF